MLSNYRVLPALPRVIAALAFVGLILISFTSCDKIISGDDFSDRNVRRPRQPGNYRSVVWGTVRNMDRFQLRVGILHGRCDVAVVLGRKFQDLRRNCGYAEIEYKGVVDTVTVKYSEVQSMK